MEVKSSLETLVGKTKPPEEIHLTFKLLSTMQAMQDVLNSKWIGFIPYCVYCKIPLNYIYKNGATLFQCPKCNTRWVKNDTWEGDSEDGAKSYKNLRTRLSKE